MNNKKTLISVIIPVYNVENYLCRCVESVLVQDYSDLEIVLVDDGSTDKSSQICDSFAEKDSRIVVLHKENGGLSSARNAGLDICKGEYISFIDSDDWIEQGMYSTMLSAIESESVLLACCGRNDVIGGIKTIGLCHATNEVIDSQEAIRRILLWDNMDSSACDKLFNRTLLDDFRFPIGRISEDVAVMYKIVDCAKKIALVATPFYNYFHREGSITTASFNTKSLDIIKNIDEMECFLRDKYTILLNDFTYFKCVEYSHLLSLLARNYSKQYSDIGKGLCNKLKGCNSVYKMFPKKTRGKLFLLQNYITYSKVYKPLLYLKDKVRHAVCFFK